MTNPGLNSNPNSNSNVHLESSSNLNLRLKPDLDLNSTLETARPVLAFSGSSLSMSSSARYRQMHTSANANAEADIDMNEANSGVKIWTLVKYGGLTIFVLGIAGSACMLLARKVSVYKQSRVTRARNDFLQAACDGDIDKLVEHIRAGRDLSCADKNGSNALMLAAWAGQREAVMLLLHSGADVHAISQHGWTALTYAARAGEEGAVEALLTWGADVNVVENTTGATPLMFAAFVGSLECVELLLDYGANPLSRTRQGALAFAFAEENGHDGIAGMLRHRAAEAQADVQARKEKEEAQAARQKAKHAIMLRKKQEQAFIRRIEEQREKAAMERTEYLASFDGQTEMLSVGCYIPLDSATARELVWVLMEKRWDATLRLKSNRPRMQSVSASLDFEPLHKDLLRRRALNSLSRPMLINPQGQDSDSEEDEEESSSEEDDDSDSNYSSKISRRKYSYENGNSESEEEVVPYDEDKESSSQGHLSPRAQATKNGHRRNTSNLKQASDISLGSTTDGAWLADNTAEQAMPSTLLGLFNLVYPVLSKRVSSNADSFDQSQLYRLRHISMAVNFGDQSQQGSGSWEFAPHISLMDQTTYVAFHVLSNLGSMASAYSARLTGPQGLSSARLRMPYCLQVDAHVVVPLAQMLVVMLQLEPHLSPSDDSREFYHRALKAVLEIVQAHLATIAALRLETSRVRDLLAVLGDALLAVALGTNNNNYEPNSANGGEMDQTTFERNTSQSANEELLNAGNGRDQSIIDVKDREATNGDEKDQIDDGDGEDEDESEHESPASLASRIFAENLRVLFRSSQDESRFLARLWKPSRDKRRSLLRQHISEAFQEQRAISYLVCEGADCPRPSGEVGAARRRLARVLGVIDMQRGMVPSFNRRHGSNDLLRRNASNFEDMDLRSSNAQSTLKHPRMSSSQRRESMSNRVRVRSVLGEHNSGTNSTLLKRRSQALLTIQRAAKAFMAAGRTQAERRATVGSAVEDPSYLDIQTSTSALRASDSLPSPGSTPRDRKPVPVEDVEAAICASTTNLWQGKIPSRVSEWMQDNRAIVTRGMHGLAVSDESQHKNLKPELQEDALMVAEELSRSGYLTDDLSLWELSKASSNRDSPVSSSNRSPVKLLEVLLDAVVDNDDVYSAVVLRCLQDDLISRLLVILKARRERNERLGPPLTPSGSDKVEKVLLNHCNMLFAACLERCSHERRHVDGKYDENQVRETRCLIEDVVCELAERLSSLQDWQEGADKLHGSLLDLLQAPYTPAYIRTTVTRLLCAFARGRMNAVDEVGAINEQMEGLLRGRLFSRPAQPASADQEPVEVFLQDLARTPAQPVHQSDAQALHALISSRIEMRAMTLQSRGKPSVLEDVVRISAAAYLKHTGLAVYAYEAAYGLASLDSPQQTAKINLLPRPVVDIWKAAWNVTHTIISVHRDNQRFVCGHEGCTHAAVAEDDGGWRCEVGHISESHQVVESQTYQEICADVAARARILLNQHADARAMAILSISMSQTSESDDEQNEDDNAAGRDNRGRISGLSNRSSDFSERGRLTKFDFAPILKHAQYFVESSASDGIKPDSLELYLKAKFRYSRFRLSALDSVQSVFRTVLRLQTSSSSASTSRADNSAREVDRASAFRATTARGLGRAQKQESLEQISDPIPAMGAPQAAMDAVLAAVRDIFGSMTRPTGVAGHHPLDYQMPTDHAEAIQHASMDILDMLLTVAERSESSEEIEQVLEVLQIISIRECDHEEAQDLRVVQRLIALMERVNEYTDDQYLQGCVWSVFTRVALQVFFSPWLDMPSTGRTGTSSISQMNLCDDFEDESFEEDSKPSADWQDDFDGLQCLVAMTVYTGIKNQVAAMQDPLDPKYERAERLCHGFVCLLGSLCCNRRIMRMFAKLIGQYSSDDVSKVVTSTNTERDSRTHSHLIFSLITCSSPRVQQLTIRLGWRLLLYCDASFMTPFLFRVAGKWALSLKEQSPSSLSADLALECAEMLRNLAVKGEYTWRPAIIQAASEAALEYLDKAPDCPPDTLFAFWTTLAVLDMSSPSTLRPGCRVKVVTDASGLSGWSDCKPNQEYGIVIRSSRRLANVGRAGEHISGNGMESRTSFTSHSPFESSSSCMVILDSDTYKIPVKCDADKVIPVTILVEEFQDLFASLRDSQWLLRSIELFTTRFWSASLQKDLVWNELKSMSMSVLHAWLSTDATHAISTIASSGTQVWRNLVSICACPAPRSNLESVDDITSTGQAMHDIKTVLGELAVSPMDVMNDRAARARTVAEKHKGLAKSSLQKQENILGSSSSNSMMSLANTAEDEKDEDASASVDSSLKQLSQESNSEPYSSALESARPAEVTPVKPMRGRAIQASPVQGQKSLLAEPVLAPSRRAALARQASTQMFASDIAESESEASTRHTSITDNESSSPSPVPEDADEGSANVPTEALVQPPSSSTSLLSTASNFDTLDIPKEDTHHQEEDNAAPSPADSTMEPDEMNGNGNERSLGVVLGNNRSTRTMRRSSSTTVQRRERRLSSGAGSTSSGQPRRRRSSSVVRKTVKFESSASAVLQTPFREMDREDQTNYAFELQVERNRRRARMERKRRAARRLRTLSSSASHQIGDLQTQESSRYIGDLHHGLNVNIQDEVGPAPFCLPDTPRGRDAAALPLPVELPTVDTMLSVPVSSMSQNSMSAAELHEQSMRAVVREGTLLRISQHETGVVKRVQQAPNGHELALVHICNSLTGMQTTSWRAIADLELSEDIITDRYRLAPQDGRYRANGNMQANSQYSAGCDSSDSLRGLSNWTSETGYESGTENVKRRLSNELCQLFTRSAILNARRGAVAAISGSVGSANSTEQMQLLLGEAGGASQILGMLKLCESSASSDVPQQPLNAGMLNDTAPTAAIASMSDSGGVASGLWRVVAMLFRTNDSFADMLLDEAILYLSIMAKNTLFFETPHPLCPIEELDVGASEESIASDEDMTSFNGSEDGLSRASSAVHQSEMASPPTSPRNHHGSLMGRSTSAASDDMRPPTSVGTGVGSYHSSGLAGSPQPSDESDGGLPPGPLPPPPPLRSRRLSGSHRFCIRGASGLLVEFDRRSSVISDATQVTLSYDPQDREVITVLGEGGADTWQPVVVSGDTCYIHWNVNHSDILGSLQRLEELNVDIDEVAWGVAVRVRSLEDVANADEMEVLERPFGWRLLQVIAENPDRVLERSKCGTPFFQTAVSYLRTQHLAFKPELCEVLTLLVKARMDAKEDHPVSSWDSIMRKGLYKLHHDLLLLFDEVAEDGFTSVSPYFVCLLELLVLCRQLWALQDPATASAPALGRAPHYALDSAGTFDRNTKPNVFLNPELQAGGPDGFLNVPVISGSTGDLTQLHTSSAQAQGSHQCSHCSHGHHEHQVDGNLQGEGLARCVSPELAPREEDVHARHLRARAQYHAQSSRKPAKAPLCTLVVFGCRENSKMVVDCETCRLVGPDAVCLACAATCHAGHMLRNERTTTAPCGCSLRGPEACNALRPFADVWKIGAADRTWFDVVCQTADVIDCISNRARAIPFPFIQEAYRTCSDGKLLRLCLRSLEECLRSEVQDSWWDREARHMWASMLDQGMDSVAEVAFGLKVLVGSLLPMAFQSWWRERSTEWFRKIHTNQAWELAQAMVQLNFALSSSACYPEWDARQQNWITTLASIADVGDANSCTYLLSEAFPRPQVYYMCKTCELEICEPCAARHAQEGHELSEETSGPGFCDERTQIPPEKQKPHFEDFAYHSVPNFDSLHDLYWMNHEGDDEMNDDQVPTEPRTLAALLNIPHAPFLAVHSGDNSMSRLRRCASVENSNLMSPCLEGILIELLSVKEECDFLCVSCDGDHGLSLALGGLLSNGQPPHGQARIHGLVVSEVAAKRVRRNMHVLRTDFGAPLGPIEVFAGDLLAHSRAVSDFGRRSRRRHRKKFGSGPGIPPLDVRAIPGMLSCYDRIFVTGVCTEDHLDALSSMLPLDGALLCPMVDTLQYGIYVQRNHFTGECERRTLAPLYEDSRSFSRDIRGLRPILQASPEHFWLAEERFESSGNLAGHRDSLDLMESSHNSLLNLRDRGISEDVEDRMLHDEEEEDETGTDIHDGEGSLVNVDTDSDSERSSDLLGMGMNMSHMMRSREHSFDDLSDEAIQAAHDALVERIRLDHELMKKIGEPWQLDGWIALADFANKMVGRETATLGFRDINASTLQAYPVLQEEAELEVIQGRFAVLKRVNDSLSEVLPLINLTPRYSAGGIGKQLSRTRTKRLIFLSTKLAAWAKVLEPMWSEAPAVSIPSITVSRKLADIGLVEDSLFMQTYNQVQTFPLCSLRRRDQSFKVRFAGEGGQDLGGLYRDLISEICSEIRTGRPALLFTSPLMAKSLGDVMLPRPSLKSPVELRLFEFLGTLLGIACLRHGVTLALDISPLVWKVLVRDHLVESDLRYIDDVALQRVSFVRRTTEPEEIKIVFEDTVFAVTPSDANVKTPELSGEISAGSSGPASVEPNKHTRESSLQAVASSSPSDLSISRGSSLQNTSAHNRVGTDLGAAGVGEGPISASTSQNVVELCPLGKERKVMPRNAMEYADLLESFRLTEVKTQVDALKRGMAPLVPARLLPMFNWQELQSLCCGVTDVDVEFLHSRTKYIGGLRVTDRAVKFLWDVLGNDFSPEDRTQFLRFVWGRERMSEVDEITFTIGPHLQARDSGDPDKYLPQAHTCFMSLSLPNYSSKEILRKRLHFAIYNCNAIDADDTGEGIANRALDLS